MPAALFLEQESPVLHVSMHSCVCLRVCVNVRVRARVCVCVCVCVEGSIHPTAAIVSTCCTVLRISENLFANFHCCRCCADLLDLHHTAWQ